MLGLRITPPGPFWLEDLAFLLVDTARRLPARMANGARALARPVRHLHLQDVQAALSRAHAIVTRPAPKSGPEAHATAIAPEAERLDAPLEWTLATEPIATAGTGTTSAIALHEAAGEQLDALSYALDRIRDEVRPLMTYARLADDKVHHLPVAHQLETSIEALLELSRQNAATRPKGRILTAA